MKTRSAAVVAAILLLPCLAPAADWPSWRGPHRDGTSEEKGLVSTWSKTGDNLVWKADLVREDVTARATPVVFDGRACVSARAGASLLRQEMVACFDAGTGKKLWERRFPVHNTTVPFSRVGWASLAGDPETGYVYAQNVDGQLVALDRTGKTVWERRLGEELGRGSGFGGRTLVPVVDEDRLIVGLVGAGWGDMAGPRQRYVAFDKKTGVLRWVSTPSDGPFEDANNNASPTVGTVDGRRLMVAGAADGWLYAVDSRTGEPVWKFHLSVRSVNSPPLIKGHVVFAAHSEENVDTPGLMGRVVAIDARGKGDITKTGEIWRTDGVAVGFAAPTVADGRVHVVDNAANLHALDEKTGKPLWTFNLGTIGRGAATWADGKLYATEQTGHVFVLETGPAGAKALDEEALTMPDGRFAEVWGSFAVAYGRLYLAAEDGLYCIGRKGAPFAAKASPPEAPTAPPPAGAAAAKLLVVPADAIGKAGEPLAFEAWAFDEKGRFLRKEKAAWSLEGLAGTISADGVLTTPPGATTVGKVKAAAGPLTAGGQARVFGALPWTFDFEAGAVPRHWIGAGPRFKVTDFGGSKRLHKPPVTSGLSRSTVFVGPATMTGYTVEADLLATKQGRRLPDMGLVNQGYTLDVMGRQQKLQLRTWGSELEKSKDVPFPVEPDVWYRAKLRVDVAGAKGTVRGKVWKKGEAEPAAWTIVLEDPIVVQQGSPGLYGDSVTDVYYDDFTVKVND
ncbi:MAG TPA: PQQ-binding-like beta-propeller repeat protein [Vicinamibacteria bacterium]